MKTNFINQNAAHQVIESYIIDVTPDKSLYLKFGESGHDFKELSGEFIDNAFDAMTDEQKEGKKIIRIDITINAKKKFYSISDNGCGMDRETATKAATLGKSNKTDKDLGKFGIGLKSAAMSLSNNFTVITGRAVDDYMTEFTYNHQEWMASKDWGLPARKLVKENTDHGTTVIINKVSKINLSPNKTQQLKADISKRYRTFLQRDNVRINVNGMAVSPEKTKWAEGYPVNFNIPTKYGEITGRIGLMVESSQKGMYGFDMFRNGRLIVGNSDFAIGRHATIARVKGDVHLNFVNVNHEKNKFVVDSDEYEVAEQACRETDVFKTILKEARKKSEEGIDLKENANIDKYIDTIMPSMVQALKELEDIMLPENANNEMRIVKSPQGVLKFIHNKFTKKKNDKKDEPIEVEEPKKEHLPQKGLLKKINNVSFTPKCEYIYDKNGSRKMKTFDHDTNTLTITINKAYAGFKVTKDKNAYTFETIMDAIVEHIYNDNFVLIEKINECKESLVTRTQKYAEVFKESYDALAENEILAEL